MDNTTLIAGASVLLNMVFGVLGYLMRDKLTKLDSDLDTVKANLRHVEINYAQKSDMDAMKTEILGRFDRLEDKLDGLR